MALATTESRTEHTVDLAPDWGHGVTLSARFRTGIISGRAGGEQRSTSRDWPELRQGFDHLHDGADEVSAAKAKQQDSVSAANVVPIWAFPQKLQFALSAAVWVNDGHWFRLGAWIYVEEAGVGGSFHEVTAATAGILAVTPNVTLGFTADADVYPCLVGVREGQVAGLDYIDLGQAWERVDVRDIGRGGAAYLSETGGFPLVDGLPVLDVEPDFGGGTKIAVAGAGSAQVASGGPRIYRYPELHVRHHTGRDFAFASPAAAESFFRFFCDRRGRWGSFWIPGWETELALQAAVGPTDTTIKVEPVGYNARYLAGFSGLGTNLALVQADGTITYLEVSSAVDGGGGGTYDTLTLTGQAGVTVSGVKDAVLCFLHKVRFDSDELRMSFVAGGRATCAVPFVEQVDVTTATFNFAAPAEAQTYYLFVIDNSGSMSADVATVEQVVDDLKTQLKAFLYGGSQTEADRWIKKALIHEDRTPSWGFDDLKDERWLDWMRGRVLGEESTRYWVGCFINESSSIASGGYHNADPRTVGDEPSANWATDYAALITEYARRSWSMGKIYSIAGGGQATTDFEAHVVDAFAGDEGYPGSPGTALADLGLEYEVGIASGVTANDLLNDVLFAARLL